MPKFLADGLGVSAQNLAVLFLLFPAIAYAYAAVKQRRWLWTWRDLRQALAPPAIYQTRSVRFDIALFAVQLFLVLPAVTYAGALYSAQEVARFLHTHLGPPALLIGGGSLIMVSIVQVLASEVLGTFGNYIFHYAGHKVPLFWTLHQVHHSAEALSPFTAVRGHPLDTLLGIVVGAAWRAVVVGVALYFTGGTFTPWAISLFAIMAMGSLVQAALNHTHVPLCYGWFNRVWVGPSFHHIHHSAEPRHRDKNLGGGIPVWDWLFGTLYLPRPGEIPGETYGLGLNDESLGEANPHNSVKGYMIDPMVAFTVELLRMVRTTAAFRRPPAPARPADQGW